jgi:AmiR/NasT family two-component response regulator
MDRLRILIADDDRSVSSGLSGMLDNLGHEVVACAAGGMEAVEKTNRHSPDLVVMDIGMNDMDGLEASQRILSLRPLPILILTGFGQRHLVEQAEAIGVSGYLLKPFRQNDLETAIVLAWRRFKQMQALKKEIGDLQKALKARKLIEQAKGLLMDREAISEPEAFKRIQKMSRDNNIPMDKLAESIVLAGKLMTKSASRDRTPP